MIFESCIGEKAALEAETLSQGLHIEYTPYGQQWIDEGTDKSIITYRFTSKEYDSETGLYYYGKRYLDPVTARWMSPEPAFASLLPQMPVNEQARQNNQNLPGDGGVFNFLNLDVYHYAQNNPVQYSDPDGNIDIKAILTTAARFVPGNSNAGYVAKYFAQGNYPMAAVHEFAAVLDNVNALLAGEVGGVLIGKAVGFVGGLFAGRAAEAGESSALEQLAGKGIQGFTVHGAEQAEPRGFTPERIIEVVTKGEQTEAAGKYGTTQLHFTLGKNTVVVETSGRNTGKIVSAFSSETVNGVKGGWVEPRPEE